MGADRKSVPKHVDMKQKLDQLAENNTAIVTLINAYAWHAKTPAFTSEGDKFRNYASAWRDRWNSVMEIFMAGPLRLARFAGCDLDLDLHARVHQARRDHRCGRANLPEVIA
jgi:hypothetical protein